MYLWNIGTIVEHFSSVLNLKIVIIINILHLSSCPLLRIFQQAIQKTFCILKSFTTTLRLLLFFFFRFFAI